MRVIRGFLSGFCFLVFGIGGFSLGTGVLPLIAIFVRGKDKRKLLSVKLIRLSWRFFVWLMKAVGLIGINIENEQGLKNLRGCIIAANHPSLIDVVILVSLVENPVCVVKSKLTKNMAMKRIIQSIYITNDSEASDFISQCKDALGKGFNVVIFPEGTRTTPGIKPKYHRGLAYAAMAADAPIVPVHIEQSVHVLGKGQRFYQVSDRRIMYTLSVKQRLDIRDITVKNAPETINARRILDKVKLNIE